MTFPALPTYLPIAEAAKKYGYALDELKNLAQSGKIQAAKLPDGDVVVNEDSVKSILRKEDLPEYKKYAHLSGHPIWLSEAERRYGISTQTLSRWVRAGYIAKIGTNGNRILLNEQDVAYCADIYRKRGGQGKRVFASDGTPYKPKTAPLAT
jgi:predicted site-specific integrase-resolvase